MENIWSIIIYEFSTVHKENETKVIGILEEKKNCNSPGSPIMLYNILTTYCLFVFLTIQPIMVVFSQPGSGI
jgi:hypothetical protein